MGMLDGIFDSPNAGTYKMGSLGDVTEDGGPIYGYDDYVGDVPIKRPRKAEEVEDASLAKYREAHPLTPQAAAASAPPMPGAGTPIPGMLGGEFGGPYGAVPAANPVPDSVPAPAPRQAPPNDSNANAPMSALDAGAPEPSARTPTARPQAQPAPRGTTPAEGALDLRDADPSIVSQIWKGIQNNSSTLLNMGAGMMGAPSWATGMSRGFAGAAAGSQADMRQNLITQGGQQLYTALVAAGAPKQQAIAATVNPELAKRLMDNYLVDRKNEIKVVKDSLGNERLVAVNPYMPQDQLNQATTRAFGGDAGESGEGPGPGGPEGGAPADLSRLATMPINIDPTTGRDENFAEAFKAADPINYAATQKLLEGNMSGTGRNLQQLMKYAARIEPGPNGFNQATFTGRQNLYKSYYGGGEGFKQLRSANTTVDHGLKLDAAIDRLHNFTILPDFLNPVTGTIARQYSGKYQAAVKDFNAAADIYSHELENALTGKSTVSGYKELRGLFDKYASPEENHSALQSTIEKLGERVHEHESAYNRGMGGHASTSPVKDFLTNQTKLEQLIRGGPAAPPASGVAGPAKVKWNVVQP